MNTLFHQHRQRSTEDEKLRDSDCVGERAGRKKEGPKREIETDPTKKAAETAEETAREGEDQCLLEEIARLRVKGEKLMEKASVLKRQVDRQLGRSNDGKGQS